MRKENIKTVYAAKIQMVRWIYGVTRKGVHKLIYKRIYMQLQYRRRKKGTISNYLRWFEQMYLDKNSTRMKERADQDLEVVSQVAG